MDKQPLKQLLPVRTAETQFALAGIESALTAIQMETALVLVGGKGGLCLMTQEEWHAYRHLCERWSLQQADSPEAASAWADMPQGNPVPNREDRGRILRSLGQELAQIRELVRSAQTTLSIDDYGDALAGAERRLGQCLECVNGLQEGQPVELEDDLLEALDVWHRANSEECAADLLKDVPVTGGHAPRAVLKNMIGHAFLEGALAQLQRPFINPKGGPEAA